MKRINGTKKNRVKGALLIGVSLFLVHPFSISAQQVPEASSVDQLMEKLQERDQVIADLQRRVQQLEQRVGGAPQASESSMAAQPPAAPSAKPLPTNPFDRLQLMKPQKKHHPLPQRKAKQAPVVLW